MFDLAAHLGVQSYCFRHFKAIPDLVAQVRGVGLARTELCAVHMNFDDEAMFEPVLSQFRAAGVTLSSIGVQTLRGMPGEETWFRFARMAGCRMMAVHFDIKAMPGVIAAAEKWAERYDLVLGIHNHGGYHWLGSFEAVSHVLGNAGERVGLCLDTAWCLQAGEDPLRWAEKLGSRLLGVHVKDFVFDRAGKWSDVVVGTGNLKLPELLRLACSAPNIRAVTLEYEGDITNPVPALRECVDAVRRAAP